MSEQPPYPPQPPGPPYGGPPYGGPPYGGPPPQPRWEVGQAIGYGWRKFAENWVPFVLVGLLAFAIPAVLSAVGSLIAYDGRLTPPPDPGATFQEAMAEQFHPVATLFNVLAQIVALVFTAALIRGSFDAVEGRRVEVGAMFSRWSLLHVLVAAVLVSIMVTVGIIACILPGIVLLYFTWFTNYFIVGQGQDAITAIRSSFGFAARHPAQLLLLALVSFLVIVAGICACGVGLLVAMPLVTIAAAYTFRVLQGQPVAP